MCGSRPLGVGVGVGVDSHTVQTRIRGECVPLELLSYGLLASSGLPPRRAKNDLGPCLFYNLLKAEHTIAAEQLRLIPGEDGVKHAVDVEEDELIVFVTTTGRDMVTWLQA